MEGIYSRREYLEKEGELEKYKRVDRGV